MRPLAAARLSVTGAVYGARSPVVWTDGSPAWRIVLFTGLHVPLGLLLHSVPGAATAHAALTIAVAALLAMGGRIDRVVYAAAYIAGSEVLWRMCGAAVFWESGKYAVILIFAIALARLRPVQPRLLPVVYFLLLLPSIALAPYQLLSDEARQQISFELSGPAALAMSVLFLSQIRLSKRQWANTVIALAGPLVAIVAVAVYNTVAAPTLNFTLNSNKVTSGGYGPNQVSTVLGLGAVLAFLAGVGPRRTTLFRLMMIALALLFATQSAMTFSRGGLYSAGGAVIAGSWYLLRDPRARMLLILAAGACGATAAYIIVPRLEQFTEGRLGARFQVVSPTRRDVLVRQDVEVFLAHPLGGVGPGGGDVYHARGALAHTEPTRLLAEHGLLGAAALVALFVMMFRAMRASQTANDKALVAALLVWSMLTMSHMAMRIVAPSLLFGLAFAIPASGHIRPATASRTAP